MKEQEFIKKKKKTLKYQFSTQKHHCNFTNVDDKGKLSTFGSFV